jgi:hypothetical protein
MPTAWPAEDRAEINFFLAQPDGKFLGKYETASDYGAFGSTKRTLKMISATKTKT